MDLGNINKRRIRLALTIAETAKFEVCSREGNLVINGAFALGRVFTSSKWMRENYSTEMIPPGSDKGSPFTNQGALLDDNSSLLVKDLRELARRKWVFVDEYPSTMKTKIPQIPNHDGFITVTGNQSYWPDATQWQVGLLEDGFHAIVDHLKPEWKKAYEKEPVTFVQVVVTVIIAVVTFIGGYFVGKSSPSNPSTTSTTGP